MKSQDVSKYIEVIVESTSIPENKLLEIANKIYFSTDSDNQISTIETLYPSI